MGIALAIRSLVQRLGRSPNSNPDPLPETGLQAHSPIETLPVEILQQIMRNLSPSSAYAFALCSCRLLEVLDLQAVRPTAVSPEFLNLLSLLERDMPDHILCVSCGKLHRTQLLVNKRILPWSLEPPNFNRLIWKPKCAAEDYLLLLPMALLRPRPDGPKAGCVSV